MTWTGEAGVHITDLDGTLRTNCPGSLVIFGASTIMHLTYRG
jgi:hypothetical protein